MAIRGIDADRRGPRVRSSGAYMPFIRKRRAVSCRRLSSHELGDEVSVVLDLNGEEEPVSRIGKKSSGWTPTRGAGEKRAAGIGVQF